MNLSKNQLILFQVHLWDGTFLFHEITCTKYQNKISKLNIISSRYFMKYENFKENDKYSNAWVICSNNLQMKMK